MSTPFNRNDFFAGNVPNKGIMKGLQSPLQEEFKDGDFEQVIGLIDYVPFMDCGDATLRVVRDLSELSPTQGGCIRSKIDYATAGGLGFIKQADSVFKRQNNKEATISDAEHDAYAAFLESVLDTETLMPNIVKAMRNYEVYGNMVVEVVLTKTGATKGGTINVYDAAMFRYKREAGKVITNRAYLSQRWDFFYISRNRDKVVEYAMYPAFSEHADGTLRSLIHVKHEALNRTWYGLPDSFASTYFQFLEYQLGKYTTRGYENLWLPAAFIETYDMPYETDTEEAARQAQALVKQMANIYTNRGDGAKLPIVFRQSNTDAKPSTITQFQHATDEGFHLAMSETAQKQILKSHSWHSSLLEKTVGSIGNNSENADLAMITDKTVIKPLQERVIQPFRQALRAIENWVGYRSNKMTIDLKSVFETEMPVMTTNNNPAQTL